MLFNQLFCEYMSDLGMQKLLFQKEKEAVKNVLKKVLSASREMIVNLLNLGICFGLLWYS